MFEAFEVGTCKLPQLDETTDMKLKSIPSKPYVTSPQRVRTYRLYGLAVT
jgi:hypothetical protein